MFQRFEIILTVGSLALSVLFVIFIFIRIRNILFQKKARIPIWNKKVGILDRAGKIAMAISLLLLAPSIMYFIFIVAMPSTVIRVYAKTLFCIIFSVGALLEIFLCFSISEKLLKGSIFKRIVFFFAVIVCIAGAAYLFPLIPKSLPYPAYSDCVILDLPVKGTWLAGQAGASEITNGHSKNRYAIDILKLGPDGRMFKNKEKEVRDFYSYDEPIFAPADGRITQVVDTVYSDSLGNRDRINPGGNTIIMDIGNGKYVYFAHLKKGSITVAEGQVVETGTILGRIGNSGNSTHPHLHMHIQNQPRSGEEDGITYPFRFKKMQRKRLLFWREISNGALLRGDTFSN